jgi:hypothetical protein
MLLQKSLILAAFAATVVALPLSGAKAQYYGPPCSPFPLTWPFCIAGAAVDTAATIATAPFRAGPYYYYGYGQPAYAAPAPGYYGGGYAYGSSSDRVANQLNRQELARTTSGY